MIKIVNEIEHPQTAESNAKVSERISTIQRNVDKIDNDVINANVVISGKISGSGNVLEYSVIVECEIESDKDKVFAAIFG